MARTFDDIIRRVLGMQTSMPDESQPFGGSQLAPMIEDWLDQVPQKYASTAEGEMPPPDEWTRFRTNTDAGNSQTLPYIPGVNELPFYEEDKPEDLAPNRPLRRGNARHGSGIDV